MTNSLQGKKKIPRTNSQEFIIKFASFDLKTGYMLKGFGAHISSEIMVQELQREGGYHSKFEPAGHATEKKNKRCR
jgi:hypothetical protein